MIILHGHVTEETAYVVDDYPYGFRLRCKIRYYLESNNKGVRLVSQTSNPKLSGLVWNKPKFSTYCKFAGCMYLDEAGHVQWSGMHEYMETTQVVAWRETYSAGVPANSLNQMHLFTEAKILHDRRKSEELTNAEYAAGMVNLIRKYT
jgi:hypothetical protein